MQANQQFSILIFTFISFCGYSQTPITNANFKQAIETCLSTNPEDGLCYDSEYGAMPDWDVSSVTNMTFAFVNTHGNFDLSGWDVSNVVWMSGMFYSSTGDFDLSSWDVSNVDDLEHMFQRGTGNFDLSGWDVSNVMWMREMFESFNGYANCSGWDMRIYSHCDMMDMFEDCNGIVDVSGWIVNKYVFEMYYPAYFENIDISGWDVSNITDMSGLFKQQSWHSFNQDIGNWNVSHVTNMSQMFFNAEQFNADISNWDVSNVTNMKEMFFNNHSFNQDIGGWDVSSVTNMDDMFSNALSFNQDIGGWDVSNVTNMYCMLCSVPSLSTENYDALLIGWESLPYLQPDIHFYLDNGVTYCNGASARAAIIANYKWSINDGGYDCSSLGIEENIKEDVSLYPNPTRGIINIESHRNNLDIVIFNNIGEELFAQKTTNRIDLSNFSNGLYFIEISYGLNTTVKKIIKY